MSFTMMAKASVIKTGNSGRKLVLMMLADSSSDEGNCFPSYRHIADVCEMSRRSVITHISKLEEMGLLQIGHRKNTGKTEKAYWNSSNIYRLTLDSVIPLMLESGENSAPPSESPALPRGENSAPIPYNPSYPINEPKAAGKKMLSFDGIPPAISIPLLTSYVEMRKAIKAPMTQAALKILVNKIMKLASQGSEPDELLETAILSNWKSVYAPRSQYGNSTGQQPNQTSADRMHDAAREFLHTIQ